MREPAMRTSQWVAKREDLALMRVQPLCIFTKRCTGQRRPLSRYFRPCYRCEAGGLVWAQAGRARGRGQRTDGEVCQLR